MSWIMYTIIAVVVFVLGFVIWFLWAVWTALKDGVPQDEITRSYETEMEQRSEDEEEGK